MAEATAGLVPNPSGAHRYARATRAVLEEARERIAAVLGVNSREIVLTSGGTESCNLALLGSPKPTMVAISAVEHAAVRAGAERAARVHGVPFVVLPVTTDGLVDVDQAIAMITTGALVSVMAANNETGVLQPLDALVAAAEASGRTMTLHVDAIASAPTKDTAAISSGAAMISVAAQKLGGPVGTGVLVVRSGLSLDPMITGGGQEGGRRAGTEDVAGAVGLACALEEARAEQIAGAPLVMRGRRDRLESLLLDAVAGSSVTAQRSERLDGHAHLTFEGIRSEELLVLLDREGIAASAGAACASGAPQASHVLLAMGVDPQRARGALRMTLATTTTDDDVARAAAAVIRSIEALTAQR